MNTEAINKTIVMKKIIKLFGYIMVIHISSCTTPKKTNNEQYFEKVETIERCALFSGKTEQDPRQMTPRPRTTAEDPYDNPPQTVASEAVSFAWAPRLSPAPAWRARG